MQDDTRVTPRLAKISYIDEVTFHCDSVIEAVWFFNFNGIPESWYKQRKVTKKGNSLHIKNVFRIHPGMYSCFGYNNNTDNNQYFISTGILVAFGKEPYIY